MRHGRRRWASGLAAERKARWRMEDGRREAMTRRLGRPWWRRHGELLRYAVAFVAYIALGLVFKEVFLSWVWGILFLVVSVWGIPALWRRLR